jgi:hypothetical protein
VMGGGQPGASVGSPWPAVAAPQASMGARLVDAYGMPLVYSA